MVPCDTFVPRAKGTCVSCDGGVAKAIPPYPAPPTTTSRRAKSDFRLMPFLSGQGLGAGNGPKDTERTPARCVPPTFIPKRFVDCGRTNTSVPSPCKAHVRCVPRLKPRGGYG